MKIIHTPHKNEVFPLSFPFWQLVLDEFVKILVCNEIPVKQTCKET